MDEEKMRELLANLPLETLRALILEREDVADVSILTTKDARKMATYFGEESNEQSCDQPS